MLEFELLDKTQECPFCKQNTFRRYIIINGKTKKDFPSCVGVCSNISCQKKCLSPSDYEFAQEQILAKYATNDFTKRIKETDEDPQQDSKYPMLRSQYITSSLRNNNLFNFISQQFGFEEASYAFRIYRVRTHQKIKQWEGSSIFYQYEHENVDSPIAVKLIQYDPKNGHRKTNEDDGIKDEKDLLYQKSFVGPGIYCFFGRHLLERPETENKPICIVESEKTAIIASIVYPEAIWMAAGSCYYLYDSKIDEGMRDRKIIIFPDVDVKYEPMYIGENGFKRCINWYMIKNQLCGGNNVIVSGYLERVLRDKCSGCPHNNICSSSPYYSPLFASFKNGEAKLESDPDLIHCPSDGPSYRGWDIADYILNTDNGQRASFDELETPISEMDYKNIERIVNGIENLR